MTVMITAITPSLNLESALPITGLLIGAWSNPASTQDPSALRRRFAGTMGWPRRMLAVVAARDCFRLGPLQPAAAARARAGADFDALTGEFVLQLCLSPVTATAQGTTGSRVCSMRTWTISARGIDPHAAFYRGWVQRVDRLEVVELDAEQQADLQIIKDAALWRCWTCRRFRPTAQSGLYVEFDRPCAA